MRASSGAFCFKGGDLLVDDGTINHPMRVAARRHRLRHMDVSFLRDSIKPAQFGKGVAMIIGANVQPGIILIAVDDESSGLLATLVAACRLARFHRGKQPFREGQIRTFLVSSQRLFDDLRAYQHVSSHRDIVLN